MTILQKLRLIFQCFRLAGPFGLIAGVKYCFGLLSIEETGMESSIFSDFPEPEALTAAQLPSSFQSLRRKKGRFERRSPDGRNALGWKIE